MAASAQMRKGSHFCPSHNCDDLHSCASRASIRFAYTVHPRTALRMPPLMLDCICYRISAGAH